MDQWTGQQMNECMTEPMNEWMSEWMSEWTNEPINETVSKSMKGLISQWDQRISEPMNKWMNGWMNECMNQWESLNEWISERMKEATNEYMSVLSWATSSLSYLFAEFLFSQLLVLWPASAWLSATSSVTSANQLFLFSSQCNAFCSLLQFCTPQKWLYAQNLPFSQLLQCV